jgi:DNA invertase Pin-like site-specific DNA recombinase
MLDRIEGNGVRLVLVEDASRLARDLLVQELGIAALITRGITIVTAGGEDLTQTNDSTRVAMRQMAGVFAQLEKARLVAKLRSGRERKRLLTGRCEGRKPVDAATVAAAKALAVTPAGHKRRSLRVVAQLLAEAGHTSKGKPYSYEAVRRMLNTTAA